MNIYLGRLGVAMRACVGSINDGYEDAKVSGGFVRIW